MHDHDPAGPTSARDALRLRPLVPADAASGLLLTQAQNWSHRLHDWELHLALARGWGIADATGALLGTAMHWPYGERFGTVGLVVVRPDAQGRGIGRRLMEAVLNDAGPRSLRLAATDVGLELYRRLGFVECGGIVQRQGEPKSAPPRPPDPGVELQPFAPADLDAVIALDARAVGAPRGALLRALAAVTTGGALAMRDGRCVGYALRRLAGRGTTIGPVVAADETTAIALVDELLAAEPGFTRLDVPTGALALGAHLEARGLPVVDSVTPMLRGPAPPADPAVMVYGLASQAFN